MANHRQLIRPWTNGEVIDLAQSWVDIVKDLGGHGDINFKDRLWQGYCQRIGEIRRTKDQTHARWREIQAKVQKFHVYFGNIVHPDNEAPYLRRIAIARTMYEDEVGRPFNFVRVWEIVRDNLI